MPEALRQRLGIAAFLILCSLGSLQAAWQIRSWGDALSPTDAYSEANAIREVRNFLETGLWANSGLGNVVYPGLYPDQGFVAAPDDWAHSVTPSGVYTHYPPGPEYLLYVAAKIFGPTPVAHLRLLPLVVGWAAAIYLGVSIRRRFGPIVGWLVMAACVSLPLFSDASVNIHALGYAFALLLIEIGLCVGVNTYVTPLLLLGFLQGWLTFDYVFLVTLSPVAIELMLARLRIGHTPRWRLALLRCAAAGGGFVFAHLLHFAEVWAFFGSFGAALQDLSTAASYRSGAAELGGPLQRLITTDGVIDAYFVTRFPISVPFWHPDAGLADNWRVFRFLGLTLGVWWAVLTIALLLRNLRQGPQRMFRDAKILGDWLCVSLSGFAVSAAWFIAMTNHAIHHPHFLYRHLFFGFFVCLLFVVVAPVRRRVMAAATQAVAAITSQSKGNLQPAE